MAAFWVIVSCVVLFGLWMAVEVWVSGRRERQLARYTPVTVRVVVVERAPAEPAWIADQRALSNLPSWMPDYNG